MYRRRQRKKLGPAAVIDVRMFTVGPVQENCYVVRAAGLRPAVIVDPGDEAERILESAAGAPDQDGRSDPAHPHPLRPRRRRRAGRPRHRGPGLLPGARDAGPRRHHRLRAVARLRAVRELRRRSDGRRRGDARARRADVRGDRSPPATAPATSTYALREARRDLLRRRPLPGLGRSRRPARRRLADAAGVDRDR